ncbi:hypothetical protein SAMN04488116_3508 [Flagellimonas flava]|uniref:Uncharacterized protein n=1 Tax=Flagellimonas flava TaxID=570519 RepID=A0A1M5Q5D4_9FLAO|nr:hypothetical protein SAMN04488116_3508 [Allomuricauda flava]
MKVYSDCRKSYNPGTDLSEIRASNCPECVKLLGQVTHRFRLPKQDDIKNGE